MTEPADKSDEGTDNTTPVCHASIVDLTKELASRDEAILVLVHDRETDEWEFIGESDMPVVVVMESDMDLETTFSCSEDDAAELCVKGWEQITGNSRHEGEDWE